MSHFTPNDLGIAESERFLFTSGRLRWPSLVPLLLPFILLVSGSRCAQPTVNCYPRAQEYLDFRVEQHWELFSDGRGAC